MRGRGVLALFLTVGNGVRTWNDAGTLSREIALYQRFWKDGWRIAIYSYDKSRDLPDAAFPLTIVPQWPYVCGRRMDRAYHALLPVLRLPHEEDRPAVVITNQAHGGLPALLAARLWGSRIIARSGFVFGHAAESTEMRGLRVMRTRWVEKNVCRFADLCVVPTNELRDWVHGRYGVAQNRLRVIPNNVDTDLFKPAEEDRPTRDVLAVGRLSAEKRYDLLLSALRGTDRTLTIVGRGPLREKIVAMASAMAVRLQLIDRVENEHLPALIRTAKVYAALSTYEGHPKALIEGMACARACLAARSPGLSNLIVHDQTGILVDGTAPAVRTGLERLLASDGLRARLGQAARSFAVEHFSLDTVYGQYCSAIEQVLSQE